MNSLVAEPLRTIAILLILLSGCWWTLISEAADVIGTFGFEYFTGIGGSSRVGCIRSSSIKPVV